MKTLSLDEAWKRCLAMWKWIAENYTDGLVADAKLIWLAHHRPKDSLKSDCYFCEYARLAPKSTAGGCSNCPGRLVDGTFRCFAYPYTCDSYPKAFYEKLLELNAKRLEEKNAR